MTLTSNFYYNTHSTKIEFQTSSNPEQQFNDVVSVLQKDLGFVLKKENAEFDTDPEATSGKRWNFTYRNADLYLDFDANKSTSITYLHANKKTPDKEPIEEIREFFNLKDTYPEEANKLILCAVV